MSDETKAQEASWLMNNPAFVDAIDVARKQLVDAAIACPVKDDDGRRFYLGLAAVIGGVKNHLNALAQADDKSQVVFTDFYKEQSKRRFTALFG